MFDMFTKTVSLPRYVAPEARPSGAQVSANWGFVSQASCQTIEVMTQDLESPGEKVVLCLTN